MLDNPCGAGPVSCGGRGQRRVPPAADAAQMHQRVTADMRTATGLQNKLQNRHAVHAKTVLIQCMCGDVRGVRGLFCEEQLSVGMQTHCWSRCCCGSSMCTTRTRRQKHLCMYICRQSLSPLVPYVLLLVRRVCNGARSSSQGFTNYTRGCFFEWRQIDVFPPVRSAYVDDDSTASLARVPSTICLCCHCQMNLG
jgi:hypothetical protein